jgi:hypothetical protein
MHVTAFALYGPVIGTVFAVGGYVIMQQSSEHPFHLSGAATAATFIFLAPLLAFGGALIGLLPAILCGICIGFMASRGWTERRLRWSSFWVGALSTLTISVPVFLLHDGPVPREEHGGGVYLLGLVGAVAAFLATLLTTGLRIRLHENAVGDRNIER